MVTTNTTALLSVRLMVYNNELYIREAIESILMQQTNFKVEIVVGDDFSTDNTLDIIKSYKNTDNIYFNILDRPVGGIYWKDRQRLGRLHNFKNIIENCSGKYIALLDGDDYWTDPLKLQKQVDFLEKNSDYSMCFHNLKVYNQQNKSFQEDTITRKVNETTNAEDLANGNYIHTPSVVLRNDFKLPSWFSKVNIGDWSLYMLSLNNRKIYKFNEVMGVYRLHEDSIWSKLDQDRRNYLTKSSIQIVLKNLKLEKNIKSILRNRLRKKNKKSLLKKVFLKLKQKFSRFV